MLPPSCVWVSPLVWLRPVCWVARTNVTRRPLVSFKVSREMGSVGRSSAPVHTDTSGSDMRTNPKVENDIETTRVQAKQVHFHKFSAMSPTLAPSHFVFRGKLDAIGLFISNSLLAGRKIANVVQEMTERSVDWRHFFFHLVRETCQELKSSHRSPSNSMIYFQLF